MSIEERLFRLAQKWKLTKASSGRLEELVRWRVQTSTMSYDDCLSRCEWSNDLPSYMITLGQAKTLAEKKADERTQEKNDETEQERTD